MTSPNHDTQTLASPAPRSIYDFSDSELADMVRGNYAINAKFGEGENRFLLVMAVPYGNADRPGIELGEALEGFFELVQAADYEERNIQVYDHQTGQFFETSLETVEATEDEDEDDDDFDDDEDDDDDDGQPQM